MGMDPRIPQRIDGDGDARGSFANGPGQGIRRKGAMSVPSSLHNQESNVTDVVLEDAKISLLSVQLIVAKRNP